jgi:hypothetical protein
MASSVHRLLDNAADMTISLCLINGQLELHVDAIDVFKCVFGAFFSVLFFSLLLEK